MRKSTRERLVALVRRSIPLLIQEHRFWTSAPRGMHVKGPKSGLMYSVSRYYAQTDAPRPESYREDLELCKKLGASAEVECRHEIFREIASAAESGQDFSSRWLKNPSELHTAQTTRLIPVDLNAFLLRLETDIACFASRLGGKKWQSVSKDYIHLAERRRSAFHELFWDRDACQWHDLLSTILFRLLWTVGSVVNVEGTIQGVSDSELRAT